MAAYDLWLKRDRIATCIQIASTMIPAAIDGLRKNPSIIRPTLAMQGIDKNLAQQARVGNRPHTCNRGALRKAPLYSAATAAL
jgi:hypothetical protein